MESKTTSVVDPKLDLSGDTQIMNTTSKILEPIQEKD